jgi:hypothetical protein
MHDGPRLDEEGFKTDLLASTMQEEPSAPTIADSGVSYTKESTPQPIISPYGTRRRDPRINAAVAAASGQKETTPSPQQQQNDAARELPTGTSDREADGQPASGDAAGKAVAVRSKPTAAQRQRPTAQDESRKVPGQASLLIKDFTSNIPI